MIVQEDKKPSHNSKYQAEIFSLHDIICLLWPRNSPDLNMIEPCWSWLKRKICKTDTPKTRAEREKK